MSISTQKMINDEAENFEKIITFKSGQLAIVDASVIKSLKDAHMDVDPVYVPLKTSVDSPSFKIVARYDDATLRKLIIVPAAANEAEPDITTPDDRQDDLSENAVEQLRGHGGDAPARKVAQLTNPKAKRQNRNRLASATNRPPVDPVKKMENKLGQIGSSTGDPDPDVGPEPQRRKVKRAESERRNPFIESVCLFLKEFKEGNLTEEQIRKLPHRLHILETLKRMKARCFGGWKLDENHLVNEDNYTADPSSWELRNGFIVHKGGKRYDFDLIYEAINRLEDVTEECVNPIVIDSEEAKLFDELILRRLNLE